MISGRKPFTGASAQAVLSKRFTDPVPSIRAVYSSASEEVETALQKALSKEAAERYGTTMEFARGLVAHIRSNPDGSPLTLGVPGGARSLAGVPFVNLSSDH